MRMPFTSLRLPRPSDLPEIMRQVEHDIATVIDVLKPGPLGILEHKFTDAELRNAEDTVARAVGNWRRNTDMEKSHRKSVHSSEDNSIDM